MRKILALFFVLVFSASAFAWTREVVNAGALNTFNAIHGYAGTSLVTLCAVGNNGTVYRSTNYGKSWTPITSGAIIGTTDLKGVSVTQSAIYVVGQLAGVGKLFKSTDWGSSWTETVLAGPPTDALDVAFVSPDKGIFSGSYGGGTANYLMYTTTGGTTWTPGTGGGSGGLTPYNAVCWADANTAFACGNNGTILKSTNGGATWTLQAAGLTANNLLDIFFVDDIRGFAGSNGQEFLYTIDGGTNWYKYNIPTSGTDYVVSIYGIFATNESSAWIVGYNPTGRIIKMTKSGSSWSCVLDYHPTADGETPTEIFGLNEKNMWTSFFGSAIIASSVTVEATAASQEGKTFNRVPQGFGGNITINGNFQIGPTAVAFSGTGVGVTVGGTITRVNANQLRVPITVTPTATISNRNITVNINGFTSTLLNGLAVVPGPTINALNPARVYQNWIGTITATGSAFQVDPGSTIFFEQMTAGTTLELISAPTIVSTTTAVATVSATDVGNFRLWARNADTGVGYFDFFVVSSFSPPTPESIAFNGITYDATDYPIDGRQLISPTPRVTAIFTDIEQGFNASSQNTAKLILLSDGTLTSIYDVSPEGTVRLEAGNTRAVIDFQIPAAKAFPSAVNTVQAYIENSSGEASRVTAKVRIGYAMMSGVSDRIALAYPVKWDPDKDDHLDLQFKTKVDPLPLSFMIEGFNIAGMRIFSLPATPRVVFSYSGPDNPYKIVKVSLRKSDYQSSLHLLSQGLLLMIIPEANVRAKVMVQYR